jgi:hypothetical protein
MSNFFFFLLVFLYYLLMNLNCAICGEVVTDDKHYYKNHKIKVADYFVKYFPRTDKFSNEPIPFKNKKQYLESDFINKNTLRSWLKQAPLLESQKYCIELLKRRKTTHNLVFAPCQVELRSIIAPSIIFYDKIFPQGYQEICSGMGLVNRFNKYEHFPQFNEIIDNIVIDTREQSPYKFENIKIEIKKLDFGDYKFSNPQKTNVVYFERKSGADFLGTLSK